MKQKLENKTKYWIIDTSILPHKQVERNEKGICTFIHYDKFGNKFYSCKNKVSILTYFQIPMNKPIYIWIKNGMLCKKHINHLSNTYAINFKKEIPKLSLSKPNTILINHRTNANEYSFTNSKMIKSLKKAFENQKIDKYFDPEHYWWNEKYCLMGLPKIWLDRLELINANNQNSSNQGKYNGPDFIFKDTKNEKIIGLEIVSWKWNTLNSFKKINQVKKYTKSKITNYYTLDDEIKDLQKILDNKVNKQYQKCNETYLGIVVKNTLVEWQYFVFELIINKHNEKINSIFQKIFIL